MSHYRPSSTTRWDMWDMTGAICHLAITPP
jgi:hypothetical protein